MATIRSIPTLVRQKFSTAQSSGDLTFYATQVSILSCGGLPFQLRFSPALANKPKAAKSKTTKSKDPFEDPPKELFISDLGPNHYLVLNKFPVIPDHFILATKQFKEQTDLLEEEDIGAAYECLKAYQENEERLFGFFNSGEHSGASQPHRHIQFLPIGSMRGGIEQSETWNLLADTLLECPDLPFRVFASRVPSESTPKILYNLYKALHEKAVQALVNRSPKDSAPSAESRRKEESPISYNLGLTDQVMVLCPRVSEGLKITSSNGKLIGPIALNGTILGGTLLVKSEEEWQSLKSDETKLADVLAAIGIPSASSERL
ncbi:Ap4A phosphorylase-like protein II [Tricladium varicosporioides]|nr:Ap4A phosphorylase-like protein II [Hymenoscyphus varicosporioides]